MSAHLRSRSLVSLALVASLAGALLGGSAAAQSGASTTGDSGHPARHERKADRRGKIARELGLTRTQREQVRAAAKANRPAMEQTRQSMRAAADTLRAALAAKPRDAATVAAAHVALDQARDAGKAAREARRAAMGAALTPEQRAQFKAACEAKQAQRR